MNVFPFQLDGHGVVSGSSYYRKFCCGEPRFAFHLDIFHPLFKEAAVCDDLENYAFYLMCVGLVALSLNNIYPFQG